MPAPRPEYDLHLTEDEANVVLQGLGELPAKVGFNLINKVAQIVATSNKAWQDAQPGNGLDTPAAAPYPVGPQGSVPQDNP